VTLAEFLALPRQRVRRRYGRTTFTWVSVALPDGATVEAGDPWPVLTPRRNEEDHALTAAWNKRAAAAG
jgi:hypothetical protein